MGTHRTPMLGRRSYSDRFSARTLGLSANEFVTFEERRTSGRGEIALPGDGVHVFDRFQALHQATQLGQTADLHGRGDHGGLVVVDLHLGTGQVDLALRDDRGDVAEQSGAVPGFDFDADGIELAAARVPIDLNHPLLVGHVHDVLAGRPVHRDALAPGDVPADGVAWHGLAALRDLREHPAFALHPDLAGGLELRDQRDQGEYPIAVGLLTGRHVLQQDGVRADVPVSDRGVEIGEVSETKFPGQLEDSLITYGCQRSLLHAAELFVQLLLSLGDVLFAPLLLEPGANLLRRAGGLHEAQPVTTRAVRALRGQHLDDVAVLQRIVERYHAAVRLGADTAVADFGVDPVGEVNRRRPGGQGEHVALGGEDEHLVPEDVDLDRVDEFLGVEHLLLPVDQLPQPGKPLVHLSIVLAAAFLVRPVRCHSPLGGAMHLLGANLDFHRLAAVADHGRVQRLIAVGLWHGDVILEAARDGLPERVDDAQRAVAIFDRVGGDSDGRHVVDLIKVLPHRKFVRDAVHVLRTAGRLRLDTYGGRFPLENLLGAVDRGLPLRPLARDLPAALRVFVRIA